MFVDRHTIHLIAGDGGDGCVSFRREKYVPRGGPDGGDGGHGGSIIIIAKEGVDSLAIVANRAQWKAQRGGHGSGARRRGKNGEDVIIHVPPGTIIFDAEEEYVIKDLVEDGEELTIAQGGRGGKGNSKYKSATNQAPREFTHGGDGENRLVTLELKVIADVGLVGKPNAGKSTLLSRLTRARPEIADYPFTTKFPNLGRVQVGWDRSFVMADIPGLIEGAHQGVGLGHEFLRHIERAGIIVHLVEPMPMDGTDPIENYDAIYSELVQYNEQLAERPHIVVVTKSELPDAEIICMQLKEHINSDVLLISAVTGSGLDALTHAILRELAQQKVAQ
ncbi:MAG: GTPase ObgE [Pirellulaceae bacterium]